MWGWDMPLSRWQRATASWARSLPMQRPGWRRSSGCSESRRPVPTSSEKLDTKVTVRVSGSIADLSTKVEGQLAPLAA